MKASKPWPRIRVNEKTLGARVDRFMKRNPAPKDNWPFLYLYVDHGMRYSQYLDRSFFSAYTPEGVQDCVERRFMNAIMRGKGSKRKLRREIECNPHLHPLLKENLILNLRCFGSNPEFYQHSRFMPVGLTDKQKAQRIVDGD